MSIPGTSEVRKFQKCQTRHNCNFLVDNFVLGGFLGEGSFGEVIQAVARKRPKQWFAIKMLRRGLRPTDQLLEISNLYKTQGLKNVISHHAISRVDDRVYIVMEHKIEEDRAHAFYQFSHDDILKYMYHLFVALDEVHSRNLVHLDVKPANFIFNRRTGMYCLVDFGLCHDEDKDDQEHKEEDLSMLQNDSNWYCMDRSWYRLAQNIKEDAISFLHRKSNDDVSDDDEQWADMFDDLIGEDSDDELDEQIKISENARLPKGQRPPIDYAQMCGVYSIIADNYSVISDLIELPQEEFEEAIIELCACEPNTLPLPLLSNLPNLKRRTMKKICDSIEEKFDCTCAGEPFVCDFCKSLPPLDLLAYGTAGYRAPEMILQNETLTGECDIFAASRILQSLLLHQFQIQSPLTNIHSIPQFMILSGTESFRKFVERFGHRLVTDINYAGIDFFKFNLLFELSECSKQSFSNRANLWLAITEEWPWEISCELCAQLIHKNIFGVCVCKNNDDWSKSTDILQDGITKILFEILELSSTIDPLLRANAARLKDLCREAGEKYLGQTTSVMHPLVSLLKPDVAEQLASFSSRYFPERNENPHIVRDAAPFMVDRSEDLGVSV